MLGVVNIQQNDIIKIFSVAAVVFMPPTLVASIYGMNFKHMPELEWTYGYPMALVLMVFAAVVPYMYFKWRKWLWGGVRANTCWPPLMWSSAPVT